MNKFFKITVTLNAISNEKDFSTETFVVPEDQVIAALRNIMAMESYRIAYMTISPTLERP